MQVLHDYIRPDLIHKMHASWCWSTDSHEFFHLLLLHSTLQLPLLRCIEPVGMDNVSNGPFAFTIASRHTHPYQNPLGKNSFRIVEMHLFMKD